jgi:hypothetical protein
MLERFAENLRPSLVVDLGVVCMRDVRQYKHVPPASVKM